MTKENPNFITDEGVCAVLAQNGHGNNILIVSYEADKQSGTLFSLTLTQNGVSRRFAYGYDDAATLTVVFNENIEVEQVKDDGSPVELPSEFELDSDLEAAATD